MMSKNEIQESFKVGASYCNCCDVRVHEPVICKHDGLGYCEDCLKMVNKELGCTRCGETATAWDDMGPLCTACKAYYDGDYND